MTKYLTQYRKYILSCLERNDCDFEKLLQYHKDKIAFFQHERLIHLIVMSLFAVCTIMTLIAVAVTQTLILVPLAILLLVLLVPYIRHYYFLENTTQQLYKDYDRLYEKVYGFSQNGDK